ncbi:hypothetical protein [Photobacterium leiognathi]|uniref:Uncharacterized protein n=1 Tax=Photobacterium leiognathi subsp. mandapamensis TaxID=48408 RepID=A0A2T3KZ21_PHOLD|nr:hypothetical protein [Photobacterium leiognathi]PSV13368.1 hypothetical protein C0W93_00010 [Photobacterium leiognathi subsp. mandapamensis]
MNYNGMIKLSMICVSLFMISGCTYHKAMNEQERRQAIIEANLSQENQIAAKQEIEKVKLEKEVASLESEILSIDKEIAKIKARTEKIRLENKKKAQKDYLNQLAILEKTKISLQNDISEKQEILSTL